MVSGGVYNVTTEDGVEVSRTRVGNTYETVYDYYKTDTKTTFNTGICHCAICGEFSDKISVHSTSNTTKLS